MHALALLLLAAAAPAAHAWGSVGHTLTGQLAQKLMQPATYAKLAKILPSSFNGDVGRATTWADEVKRSSGYGWSGQLHYSDANDNPSQSCSYDYQRDCPDGQCVVGAIANYTQRLTSCRSTAAAREEAAKFITHFMGDITQPLHLCARDKGGNEASVTFDRKHTLNLHTIWDTTMIEKRMKNDFGNSQPRYLNALLQQATTTYKSQKAAWTSCMSNSDDAALNCPIEWASDSDEMNCSAVWPAYDQDASQNFGEDYYNSNIELLERQLIKAGVRMAAWFDKYLADSSCSQQRTRNAHAAGGKVGWLSNQQ